eukprot:COSAG01_NODE_2312_length_7938_cov_4.108687_7_plen_81_part_00
MNKIILYGLTVLIMIFTITSQLMADRIASVDIHANINMPWYQLGSEFKPIAIKEQKGVSRAVLHVQDKTFLVQSMTVMVD